MKAIDSHKKAEILRDLHRGPEVLILPNAWDSASARIFEEAGFPAIATTSGGVAFSLGYPDGQHIPQAEMIDAVTRIARCVRVPVTADLEAGYGDMARTAAALVESGAVGLNLEDIDKQGSKQLVKLAEQVERIRTLRRTGDELGVHIVINARTEYYLAQIGDPEERFDAACHRLKHYIDAGADCVFVPSITDANLIQRFVNVLEFPLNVLVGPGTPSVARLKELGVARLSVGSGITRSTMGLTRRIADELMGAGEYQTMLAGAMPYAEANELFKVTA
ncbi:MAG TPA: isocitrate lyase/phosphoenolpyruvate mutase family protein [Bryobacteraceae bacterium]|nr:isocitrate lyase/phosphoenolpyruvate mutase family protein [Bryobacteraceae bacterium]